MSKIGAFLKLVKLIGKILGNILRLLALEVPKILKDLSGTISKRLRFSITFKTVTTYFFIFTTIYAFLSVSLITAFVAFLYYDSQETLERKALVVRDFLEQAPEIPNSALSRYAKIEGINIYVLDRDRRVIFSTEETGELPLLATNNPGISLINEKVYFNSQIPPRHQVQFVVIDKVLEMEALSLIILLAGLTISFVLYSLFMTFRGSKALKRMLKPIDDMIRTARSISAHDLKTRLNVVNSHDELKDLAETFNEMLDRIETSYEKQNRFVSDASHELRTPIAVIKGYANLLQRWGKGDQEILEESVLAIQNETENMQILVERLLFLARADKDTQKLEKTKFNLDQLLEEVIKDTRLIGSNHKVIGSIGTNVVIEADKGLIKQALRVFLENSMKFTPSGGTIKISSTLNRNHAIIIIQDSGIGIPPEDLPHIFNRFYKSDKSRTRGKGGTGLGLSIAKWIIDKHQGSIVVDSVVDIGTKVTVTLPLKV